MTSPPLSRIFSASFPGVDSERGSAPLRVTRYVKAHPRSAERLALDHGSCQLEHTLQNHTARSDERLGLFSSHIDVQDLLIDAGRYVALETEHLQKSNEEIACDRRLLIDVGTFFRSALFAAALIAHWLLLLALVLLTLSSSLVIPLILALPILALVLALVILTGLLTLLTIAAAAFASPIALTLAALAFVPMAAFGVTPRPVAGRPLTLCLRRCSAIPAAR